MTAEIAILNKSAVVLATDSAGTINLGFRAQIHNSTDKLFMLSKKDPVGIMIYQNLSFAGVPFETIIKLYRKKLGNVRFDTLKEYSDDFFKFLISYFKGNEENQMVDIINKSSNRIKSVYNFDSSSCEGIISFKEFLDKEGDFPDESIMPKFFEYRIDEQIKKLEKMIYHSSDIYPSDLIEEIQSVYHDTFKDIISSLKNPLNFESLLTETSEEKLLILCSLSLFESFSGIVIAGFGKNDIFPSLVSTTLYSIYNNKLYMNENISFNITEKKNAKIIPFAQTDMVETFLHGVSKSFQKQVARFIKEKIKIYPEIMNSSFKTDEFDGNIVNKLNDVKQEIEENFNNHYNELTEEYEKLIKKGIGKHINPILHDVINLPKNEMAVLAESLVHLISLKRKFSLDQDETVGGDIDVAIISKGDGFIWAKRKHYFDPELNHHYVNNYEK